MRHVIEAIVEDLDIKTTLFQSLEGIVAEDAMATTPHHCPSQPWPAGARPDRVIGLHFFNLRR